MKNCHRFFFVLRRFFINCFYHVGKLVGLNTDTVSVLCYHSFSDNSDRYSINLEAFARQIKIISRDANFVSLDDIVESMKGKKLKTPAVALTIDDGYTDVMQILPLTKRYRIPITLFILSEPHNANWGEIKNERPLLNSQELKYLISQGWTIGCHSATHADFSSLNQERLKKEIIEAKKTLEEKLGMPVKYFAYPKGVFNEEIIRLVKEAGYEAAFAVAPNCVNSSSNKLQLPRVVVDKTHALDEFPALFCETTFFLRRITEPLKLWNIFLQTDQKHGN